MAHGACVSDCLPLVNRVEALENDVFRALVEVKKGGGTVNLGGEVFVV